MAALAFGPSGKSPGLLSATTCGVRIHDLEGLFQPPGVDKLRIGLVVVPLVGVGVPIESIKVQDLCLNGAAGLRIPLLLIEKQCLDEHRVLRERPVWTGNFHRQLIGDSDKPLRYRMIRPRLGIDRIGNDSRCRCLVFDAAEQPRRVQRAGERSGLIRLWIRNQSIQCPRSVIQDVKFTRQVFTEADDAMRRVGQFPMVNDAAIFIAKTPDFSGVIVAVKMRPLQFFQP